MSVPLISPDIQQVFALLEQPLLAVRASLKAVTPPDSAILAETVKHSLTSGGKYMRPALTLLCGAATYRLGENVEEEDAKAELSPYPHAVIESAAVAEMIHVATLLHDDVIDRSDLRRGKKTARALWGDKIAVLGGDYLLAQASVKLAALKMPRLVSIFAWVLSDLCSGEVEQMQASYPPHSEWDSQVQWDSYYRKTVCKTASLFSAGCESAGVINRLSEERIQALKAYGRHLGIAFQIMDDLLDYTATEEELGKPVMGDLRNGLINAPVLLALESGRLADASKKSLRDAIEQLFEANSQSTSGEIKSIEGENHLTSSAIASIRTFLDESDAINETRHLARDHVRHAVDSLAFIQDSPALDALKTVANYVIERQN